MYSSLRKSVTPVCLDAYGEAVKDKSLVMDADEVTMALDIYPTKEVPVKLNITGSAASGFSLVDLNYNPQTVEIAGTEETLEKVNAIYVDDVSISGLNEKKELNLKLSDYLPEGTYLADDKNDQLAVSMDFEQQTTREIGITSTDIEVIGKGEKLDYLLTNSGVFQIKLKGLKKDIEKVTKESLQLKTDVTGLEVGQHDLKVTYAVPKNVSVSVMGSLSVTITEKKETETTSEGASTEATEAQGEH